MTLSAVPHSSQQRDAAHASVSVLLLDTPENLGTDFLQGLQRQELKLAFERVNDKEDLHAALRQGSWDILLVCDQVNVPGQDETLAFLKACDCATSYVLLSKAELSIDALTRAYRRGIVAVVSAHNPEFSLQVFTRAAERCHRNQQLSLLSREKSDLKRHCLQLMSGTQEALAYLQDGIHVFGNEAYLKLLGYGAVDDLLVMPFIDLVSTEMREKTKQRLLDFQHRARMQPDTKELEIPELFVNAIGEREGILQVAATFKPVVYEGESCVQVVFKSSSGEEAREESGAADGLGYTLFTTHLGNLIAQARADAQLLGHVAHIRGTGFEHYIARKGFGSLNGKLKALASELKASLGKDDLLIRFTETSFLVLHKAGKNPAACGAELHQKLAALLGKFEKALNREIGATQTERALALAVETTPVDAQSPPAEQVVRSFLQTRQHAALQQAAAPATRAVEVPRGPVTAPKLPEPPIPAARGNAPAVQAPMDLQRLGAALAANELKLMYETVISVSDIETDFHEVSAHLPSPRGSEPVARAALGAAGAASALAAKLDQWTLRNTLGVVADLYSRGQEYPVMVALTARSLANRQLADTLRGELKAFGLPAGMLLLDFSIHDLASDPAGGAAQLDKLHGVGINLCISDVGNVDAVQALLKPLRGGRVRLQRTLVEDALRGDKAFALLRQSVERLHALGAKVLAGDVSGNDELALCCKAGVDLVKGNCIQGSPQELDADSMAEALLN